VSKWFKKHQFLIRIRAHLWLGLVSGWLKQTESSESWGYIYKQWVTCSHEQRVIRCSKFLGLNIKISYWKLRKEIQYTWNVTDAANQLVIQAWRIGLVLAGIHGCVSWCSGPPIHSLCHNNPILSASSTVYTHIWIHLQMHMNHIQTMAPGQIWKWGRANVWCEAPEKKFLLCPSAILELKI